MFFKLTTIIRRGGNTENLTNFGRFSQIHQYNNNSHTRRLNSSQAFNITSLYEGEWKYVDEDQYRTTKAEIIKIKGHILYNMGELSWFLVLK